MTGNELTFTILISSVLFIVSTILIVQLTMIFLDKRYRKVLIHFTPKNSRWRKRKEKDFILGFVNNFASVLAKMSSEKTGALIVIENKEKLTSYINIGNKIDSPFFPELVTSIFYNKKSALHDGAIIVRDWRIASVSSYLPMTKKNIKVQYGARHRAAFGVCEKFDCLAFVVSETTGDITSSYLEQVKKLSSEPDRLASEIIQLLIQAKIIEPNFYSHSNEHLGLGQNVKIRNN